MIHPYRGVVPKVHVSAWIAGTADVIGDVELAEDSSVWFGAVVSPGTQVPEGSVVMGAPARVKRSATDKDLELIYRSAKSYVGLAAEYRAAEAT